MLRLLPYLQLLGGEGVVFGQFQQARLGKLQLEIGLLEFESSGHLAEKKVAGRGLRNGGIELAEQLDAGTLIHELRISQEVPHDGHRLFAPEPFHHGQHRPGEMSCPPGMTLGPALEDQKILGPAHLRQGIEQVIGETRLLQHFWRLIRQVIQPGPKGFQKKRLLEDPDRLHQIII